MELLDKDLEKQEHLYPARLAALYPKVEPPASITNSRPTSNLTDLFAWTQKFCCSNVSKRDKIHFVINNKITINGSFFEFAETHKINITCLYRDSLTSWKTEYGYEDFIAQGVFLIQSPEVEFIHAALFHKGNQFEDEVSFFIVVDESQFYKYIELRNQYEEWLTVRDRNNLEIYVVGGEGVSYTRDHSWENLFLPEDLKSTIRTSVETWLASKKIYEQAKIPWKRGVLLYGFPGNGKTLIIKTIISNYNFKPVTIEVGNNVNNDILTEAFFYAQEQNTGLLYIEDIDTLFTEGQVSLSHFLNLMDGISSKNGVFVIGTANDLTSLKKSLTDRPSRFDRKWEIPLPSEEMSFKYLSYWFGKFFNADKCREMAKMAVKLNFSYVYLKELYLSSIFNALSFGREQILEKDLETAFNQLVGDKKLAKKGYQNNFAKIGI